MQKYDAVLFDLDGTLWDAVHTVVKIWNKVLVSVGLEPTMNYDELSKCMGLRIEQIFDRVIPFATEEQREQIKEGCILTENEYLSECGGILYEGVEETLAKLKEKYKLYVVSNCQDGYIQAFFKAHDLKKYFDGYECAGRTGMSKGENIKLVAQREGLKSPVYVGDTIFDYQAAEQAGVPFIFAEYGFGEVEDAQMTANSFVSLSDILL